MSRREEKRIEQATRDRERLVQFSQQPGLDSRSVGDGVERNLAEAVKLFRLAAEQGVVKAQFNLGNLFQTGEGVNRDHAESAKWFRLAADQGHADAQFHLGNCFLEELHVEVVADRGNVPRLFVAEDVSRAADLQIV